MTDESRPVGMRPIEARILAHVEEYCRLRQREPVSHSPAFRALVEAVAVVVAEQAQRIDALIVRAGGRVDDYRVRTPDPAPSDHTILATCHCAACVRLRAVAQLTPDDIAATGLCGCPACTVLRAMRVV